MLLTDKFGRAITDLRISVTDRCNYKCVYCRTGNEGALYGDLEFSEYLRMARVLVGMGITKVRLTGGEPLLRRGVVEFVRELAKLHPQGRKPSPANASSSPDGKLDIAMTTNGHLLEDLAQALKDAAEATAENPGLLVNVAVGYGGRREIADAVPGAELVVLPGGHLINVEAAEQVDEALAAHLARW